jgi:hypothetical protein
MIATEPGIARSVAYRGEPSAAIQGKPQHPVGADGLRAAGPHRA